MSGNLSMGEPERGAIGTSPRASSCSLSRARESARQQRMDLEHRYGCGARRASRDHARRLETLREESLLRIHGVQTAIGQ
jgi:hypothetical protein